MNYDELGLSENSVSHIPMDYHHVPHKNCYECGYPLFSDKPNYESTGHFKSIQVSSLGPLRSTLVSSENLNVHDPTSLFSEHSDETFGNKMQRKKCKLT